MKFSTISVFKSAPECSLSLSLYLFQACRGIAAWKTYPSVNWRHGGNNRWLIQIAYTKTRNDTILHVEFHTMLATQSAANNHHCSSWYIRFNDEDCTHPARVVNARYTWHSDGSTSWIGAPAEISGFCSATSTGEIQAGEILISVHVYDTCGNAGSVWTGLTNSASRATTYFLVEEYCQ